MCKLSEIGLRTVENSKLIIPFPLRLLNRNLTVIFFVFYEN